MKRIQKLLASVLALVLVLTLAGRFPTAAGAEENSSLANRYNVVLVMDKSGSLCNNEGIGTDPEGLRYDAMRLFLGLLTEKGNNVGVVAFDEAIRYDSGLRAIKSMDEKEALVEAVEVLGTSYDTDIGTAVLRATEILTGMREKNGLPCAILLLTDGMTDFTAEGRAAAMMDRSRAAAQKALETAQAEGIKIHGILLNVEDRARNGEHEIRFFTDGTMGQTETVSAPEDLAATFGRFYSIINRTEYNSASKILFPADGAIETGFSVPGFGAEEVNLIIECDGASVKPGDIRITAPDGSDYGIEGHYLETARFVLIKIPEPAPGEWRVALKGEPGDSIDICMIYNASMSVTLRSEAEGSAYEVLKPCRFTADVSDTDGLIPEDKLRDIACTLSVRNLATGETTACPMTLEDGRYTAAFSFEQGGTYELTAVVSLTDFEVLSNPLPAYVTVPLPLAKVEAVSDAALGTLHGSVWELDLQSLIEDPKGGPLHFALEEDLGSAVTIEDGILRADLAALDGKADFTVLATDSYGQTTALPIAFNVELPAAVEEAAAAEETAAVPEETAAAPESPAPVAPAAKLEEIRDPLSVGELEESVWSLDLAECFESEDGSPLTYGVSDDLGGAVRVDDDTLRVDLGALEGPASFTVTATDEDGLSTSLPVTLVLPSPAAKQDTPELSAGQISGNVWSLPLDEFFDDPAGAGLRYTLSDDFDGAVTIEDGILRADLEKLGGNAAFTVTATDALGQSAELPITLAAVLPEAKTTQITDVLSDGRFADGFWETELAGFFADPAGNGLSYTLSDDLGGAVSIVDGILQVRPNGADPLDFTVTATDALGLSTSLPFSLRFPAPIAKSSGISETVKTGLFQAGTWDRVLSELFEDPKGTKLSYSLSDDHKGALKLDGDTLHADCKGIGKAEFTVKATDALGLSAEVPVQLTEKDMTMTTLGIGSLFPLAALVYFLCKKFGKKK